MSTIQVDFQLPQRFDLDYVGADNERHRPVMIHRALFGSIERFFGVLLEHYAGAFPAWLAPVQVRVLRCATTTTPTRCRIADRLRAEGFRADLVAADEPLGARIRKAKLEKLPYVLVVGDDDVAAGTVGVNARGSERPERGVPVDDLRRPPPRRRHREDPSVTAMTPRPPLGRVAGGVRGRSRRRFADADVDRRRFGLQPDPRQRRARRGDRHRAPGRPVLRRSSTASRTATGHLLVMPYREVADLDDLTDDEHSELWATVRDAVAALKARLPARRRERRRQPRRGGRRRACPATSTCTCCRGGRPTRTS